MVACIKQCTRHFFNQMIALSKIPASYQSISIKCEAPLWHAVWSITSDHLSLLKFFFILSIFFIFFPICLGHGMCVDLLWTRVKALLFSIAMGMLGLSRSQTSRGCELYWSCCKICLAALPGGIWFHCIFSGELFLPGLFGGDFLCFLS